MSIEGADGRTIIRMGNVHEAAFKISIWVGPLMALWMVSTLVRHDTQIAVLEARVGAGEISQNVNVGAAGAPQNLLSRKDWLTTAEVAQREGLSVREVVDMIGKGQVQPAPQKVDGAWRVAKDYVVHLPATAAVRMERPETE